MAKLIVVWGMNPSVSGIHLVPYIQEAQKRGARLVVVDPAAHAPGRARGPAPGAPSGHGPAPRARRSSAGCSPRDGPTAHSSRRTPTGPRSWPAAQSPGRSSAPRGRRACRRRTSRRSRASTPIPAPRRCAAAGVSSAIATAAPRPRRSWRCRPWPESSACAAAATRCRNSGGVEGARRDGGGRGRGAGDARDQHEPPGRGAGGEGERLGRPALRLQLQRAHDDSGAGAGARAASSARTSSPWSSIRS